MKTASVATATVAAEVDATDLQNAGFFIDSRSATIDLPLAPGLDVTLARDKLRRFGRS